jgi:hypothetical protein
MYTFGRYHNSEGVDPPQPKIRSFMETLIESRFVKRTALAVP